jgi:thiamine biosynthesis lipoprotein
MSAPRRSHRRAFLTGRAARDAAESFVDGLQAPPIPAASNTIPTTPSPPPATYLLEFARDAMAVEFQVLLNAGDADQPPEAAITALDLLAPLEAQLTVYRDTSEVSRLNREAASGAVAVERRLYQLLQTAQRIAAETAGAYDATSGPLSKVWGFYRRQGRMPSESEIAAALQCVGYQKLTLSATDHTVHFQCSGMELNLGGIGKGYALDRMSEVLLREGNSDFLLHGGQSSVLARGSRAGAAAEARGWTIGLAHPLRPGQRLAEFRLHNRALGTSGSGTQFFHFQGKRYGHILDPRTGRPAEGILSSTVLAPTAAEADALSTAFYVGGVELARSYCQAHPEVGAVLVDTAQRPGDLHCEVFNLTEQEWQPLL